MSSWTYSTICTDHEILCVINLIGCDASQKTQTKNKKNSENNNNNNNNNENDEENQTLKMYLKLIKNTLKVKKN